jgi:hypothetical protein
MRLHLRGGLEVRGGELLVRMRGLMCTEWVLEARETRQGKKGTRGRGTMGASSARACKQELRTERTLPLLSSTFLKTVLSPISAKTRVAFSNSSQMQSGSYSAAALWRPPADSQMQPSSAGM